MKERNDELVQNEEVRRVRRDAVVLIWPGLRSARTSRTARTIRRSHVTRGSVIIGYDFRKFDELIVPLGLVEIVYPPGKAMAKKSQTVEGGRTYLYLAPAERAPL